MIYAPISNALDPKVPVKKFQELSDDYFIEIIPATPTFNQPVMQDLVSPSLSDGEDILTSKRKGRPPSSKNKIKNKKRHNQTVLGDASPMEEIVGPEVSIPKALSQ